MPKKNKPLTQDFLVEHLKEQFQLFGQRFDGKLQNLESRFDEKLDRQRILLESKMEYYRKDAKEHLISVAAGLDKKIGALEIKLETKIEKLEIKVEGLEIKMDRMDGKLDTVWAATKANKNEIIGIQEKLEEHDRDISYLKSVA